MRIRNSKIGKIPSVKCGRREISESILNIIDGERVKKERDKDKKPQLGARQIFLNKYKVSSSVEKSKKELKEKGFNPQIYSDDILKSWIDEGK